MPPDDTPLLPHGGYRKLRSYAVAEVVYDATVVFCRRFFPDDRRMTDQMVQAARSGVRNISEGSGAAATSRKAEMKLTNVARASLSDELLRDYECFLRQNGLRLWPKDSREARAMRDRLRMDRAGRLPPAPAGTVRLTGLGGLADFVAKAEPELAANAMVCAVNQAAYLLRRQVQSQGRAFLSQGGFTESLYRSRTRARRSDQPDRPDQSDQSDSAGPSAGTASPQALTPAAPMSYSERLSRLHELKLTYARLKRETGGPRDADEQGQIPLPPEACEVVEAVSGSGVVVRDLILKGFRPVPNHPSGGFFGARAVGANFRRLLEVHPVYVEPLNSLAGVYMVNFNSYRQPGWDPDVSLAHLEPAWEKYGISPGIGGLQHFCPDLRIGLELGWGGLLAKVRHYAALNPDGADLYAGITDVLVGMQDWIGRHAQAAAERAHAESHPTLRANLETMAAACRHLVEGAPRTLREACQWLVFFQAGAKMYNGSGEWGQLDELLRPFYERDVRNGVLDDEEAIFHVACLLLSETAYGQLGGPDAQGRDQTSHVSFLVLEAVRRLKTPANLGIRVGPGCSPELFRRGLELIFEERMGFPKFLGDKACTEGYARNGIPLEVARTRVYAGCHWLAIPGREYGMMDLIKIDFAKVFDTALREMLADPAVTPSTAELWRRVAAALREAVATVAAGIDLHFEHMHNIFPELYLDLFCHGPVEKGLDATHGGLEFYTIGVDGASLATAADSFGALEQRLEREGHFTWPQVMGYLDSNWAGTEGEAARLAMRTLPRFGSGDSLADEWAARIARTFTELVAEKPTPRGYRMVPGLFSWAMVIAFGKRLGATPNGRRAGEPVSHGPNPEPGFNGGKPGTPTQMAQAVAAVQCGFGNAAPLQLDLDPGLGHSREGLRQVEALLRTHFGLGGTMVNLNVLDREMLLAAQQDPARYPDLIVRVTGFSAYFASLSEAMRQFVVDRVIAGA
jgi:formate C-acetyltransferase